MKYLTSVPSTNPEASRPYNILLDRLQGISCSARNPIAVRVHVVMLGRDRCPGVPTSDLYLLCVCLSVCVQGLLLGTGPMCML